MRKGAIILCGGRSTRMGRDKAMLPFGPETMLARVVRLTGEVVDPGNTVIVAATGQALPSLPAGIEVVRDEDEYQGPLAALATGLRALAGRADAVFATGCDVPLLVPGFVERLFAMLGDEAAVVPYDADHDHTLAAVYRPQVAAEIKELLAAGRSSLRDLMAVIRSRRVAVEVLRAFDPELHSLKNANAEKDYATALELAGFARK